MNNVDLSTVDFTQDKYKNIDLITIGSPCQSFSTIGLRNGFNDKRGAILFTFIKALKIIRPPMFLIENVKGLLYNDNGNSIKLLLTKLRKLKYHVKYKVLNAVKYDVPQKRERIFIFGSLINNKFEFPPGNHNVITLGEAFENITDNIITSKYSEKKLKYFKEIPQGGCWTALPIDDQKDYMKKMYTSRGGRKGVLRRLSYDKPSLTILCTPQQMQTERCHPTENRPLTIRESMRIQTFPDDYKFSGSITQKYKQIGNAVPVKLARHMAMSISNYYELYNASVIF